MCSLSLCWVGAGNRGPPKTDRARATVQVDPLGNLGVQLVCSLSLLGGSWKSRPPERGPAEETVQVDPLGNSAAGFQLSHLSLWSPSLLPTSCQETQPPPPQA